MHKLAFLAALTSLSFGAIAASAQVKSPAPEACSDLTRLTLPNTHILQADPVAPGTLTQPPSPVEGQFAIYKSLPALCRVVAEITPSPDSSIKIELWMPTNGWNGKFRGQGNGGFAGEINTLAIASAVGQGYASASTDTGHLAPFIDAKWALHHPEKIIDFGYRAIHAMTEKSREIIRAYYGIAPLHSYFAACSDGGREALMEAQRFPADYDGIIAGAPANYWTALLTNAVYNAQLLTQNPASYIPSTKLSAINSAVLAACDAKDGVTDGILNDPRSCHFNPAVLLCKAEESDKCLTTPQITTLNGLYRGSRNAQGTQIFPGYLPGSEDGPGGWTPWILGNAPENSLMFAFGNNYFKYMVEDNPDWNLKSANIDVLLTDASNKTASALNSTNPNLGPFIRRGGKLILYHGWNDPAIASLNTIRYYDSVVEMIGQPSAESSVRLFMAPGVQHCSGGPGPDDFGQRGVPSSPGLGDPQHDINLALEQWVESGVAPDKIIASKISANGTNPHVTMSRPLCPYPQAAKYNGSGDTNDAANFSCAVQPKP